MKVLEIIPHDSGPWLLKVGARMFVLPPGPRKEVEALAGVLAEKVGPEPPPSRGRPILCRVPLVPVRAVRSVSRNISFLTSYGSLSLLAGLGIGGYLTGAAESGRAGFSWDLGAAAAGLGLFLLSAVWHELGHAAALARSGYPPGGIGAGILVVIPVLFADVTAVGVLPRVGRIRVDVSGVVFQLAAGGFYRLLASLGSHHFWTPVLTFAAGSALFAVSWSLLPFIRSDGYWLLCDLLGLDDLDRPPSRKVAPALRIFLVLFQGANAAFLILVGILFPARMIGLLLGLIPFFGFRIDPVTARWLSWGLALVFIGAMGIGIVRRVKILLRSAWQVARWGQRPLPD